MAGHIIRHWGCIQLPRHLQAIWGSCALQQRNSLLWHTLKARCLAARSYSSTAIRGRAWSKEQLAIVARARTHNIVVSARPGSGKTATAEAVIEANPDKNIGILTYSKRLQTETAKRLEQANYQNCDVYTFHGAACRLFSEYETVRNDEILNQLRISRAQPAWAGNPYDIIIIDEIQDCTKLLFWLISAFISGVTRRSGRVPRIIVLGDERQAIYEFRGADARYLSNCPTIFADLSPDPWDRMTLTKSFRLSHQNTNFINKAFLYGENYIVGSHKGRKPLYIHTNPFRVHLLAKQLGPLIRKYGVENTAILGTSVRTNSTISKLTNYLTGKEQMPVAEPVSDDRGLDEVVIRGKICVSTIHQFKGSERDLVILYGLDDYYFQLAPQLPDDTCPNDVFVALSRAKKQIVVVHDAEKQMMPFVDISQLRKTAKHIFLAPETPSSFETRNPRMMTKVELNLPNSVNASDIARHVQDEILTATVAKHVTVTTISPRLASSEHINAPDKTPTDTKRHHFEAVSDINGVAVVAAYEFEFCGTLSALGKSKKDLAQITVPKEPRERAAWLCRESCRYLSELSTYQSRLLQMHEHRFDWLASYLTVACSRLQGQFQDVDSGSLKFEYSLNEPFSVSDGVQDNLPQHQSTSIRGRADIIQKTKAGQGVTLWEIKFVSNLSREHVVQACVYAHLWAAHHNGAMPKVILYNVRDGEKWEISPKDPVAGMRPLVEEVLRAKYTSRGKISDGEFLDECVKTREEVEKLVED